MILARIIVMAVMVLVTNTCSRLPDKNIQPKPIYKVGKPYEIDGKRYYPRIDYHYKQRGIASWYGDAFAGKPTANGEIFDPEQLTAAHQTLPMPSYVRVTNLENNRVIELRVNDRGPFVGERIIDVSRRAARELGFLEQGKVRVYVEILVEKSLRAAAQRGDSIAKKILNKRQQENGLSLRPTGEKQFYVQIIVYRQKKRAEQLLTTLNEERAFIERINSNQGQDLYRIKLGPFGSYSQSTSVREKMIQKGFLDAFIAN